MKFLAQITNKTITFGNLAYARHHLEKLEGKKVLVTVEKVNAKRSISQNKLYWLYLNAIADYTGEDAETLHRLFKGMFLPRKIVRYKGQEYSMAGSTTELTKGEFTDYLMKITSEAGQLGVRLPSVDEYKKGLDLAVLLTD